MRPFFAILVALFAIPGALALVTDPIQNDAGSGHDAGDDAADATLLGRPFGSPQGEFKGLLVPLDDGSDWYAFAMAAPGPIAVSVALDATACGTPLAPSLQASLVGPDGHVRATSFAACGAEAMLSADADRAGLWRIALTLPAGAAPGTASAGAQTQADPLGYVMGLECEPWC